MPLQERISSAILIQCMQIADGIRYRVYSTVTDLARLRGWSISVPLSTATW